MKDRNKRKLIIYALIGVLMLTTVAYASLQTILNVSGTVVKKGNLWNIYFTNPSSASVVGTATGSSLNIQASSLNFQVSLYKPGDKVTYTVDIKNGGTIDAVLNSISLTGLDTASNNNINYTVTYSDGSTIKQDDTLDVEASRTLKITVEFDSSATSLPVSDVNLTFGVTLIYQQTTGNSSSGGGDTPSTTYKDSILVGNDPNLLNDSLTPVIYDETKSSWVVADTTQEWYNYSKQEWANAVILNSGVTKNVGDTVVVPTNSSSTSEVKAMLVWIPRFEYKITGTYGTHLDGTTGTKDLPGQIEVKFISKSKTTADTNYILHPAFTWDNNSDGTIATSEHISGIWVGKFETTGTATTPTVLPNVQSLKNQNISAQFNTSLLLKNYLSTIGTTDSHMMKNSEWGAVVYLSQSIYGKYGNNSYTGVNKEIYKNDSSSYYTGRSSGTYSQSGSSDNGTCLYNNITDRGNGTGSCGGGASTTGNITGIYDMSGGSHEYVMGYLTTASTTWGATSSSNNAGFTSAPASKYYDAYTSTTSTTACSGGICYGQALSETSGWYNDYATFVNASSPWLLRGGGSNGSTSTGVFSSSNINGNASGVYSFRSVLLIPEV